MADIQRVMQIDEAKWRNMMQLGEFMDELSLLNFSLALTKWYLVHKSEGWNIFAEKEGEIKVPQLHGI